MLLFLAAPTALLPSGYRWNRDLRTMPDGDNPDDVSRDPVEEAIWGDEQLAMGQLGKFWNLATRFREVLQPPQGLLAELAESRCRHGAIPANIVQLPQEPGSCRRGEANLQGSRRSRSRSASARTSSRSNPIPSAISCSPRANAARISRSDSDLRKDSMSMSTAASRPLCVMTAGAPECRRCSRTEVASCSRSETGMTVGSFEIIWIGSWLLKLTP